MTQTSAKTFLEELVFYTNLSEEPENNNNNIKMSDTAVFDSTARTPAPNTYLAAADDDGDKMSDAIAPNSYLVDDPAPLQLRVSLH